MSLGVVLITGVLKKAIDLCALFRIASLNMKKENLSHKSMAYRRVVLRSILSRRLTHLFFIGEARGIRTYNYLSRLHRDHHKLGHLMTSQSRFTNNTFSSHKKLLRWTTCHSMAIKSESRLPGFWGFSTC